jgi:glycosyltransferase involved in cell wall biosynthesis
MATKTTENKISIITVVYNALPTIGYTIKSVVEQSYPNIEYIIIDGVSTDGTLDVIKNFGSQISILVSEKDNGIYDAMNKGLKYATGDWVYFLGADDLLTTPTIIEELVQQFTNSHGIYYGNSYLKQANKIYCGRINKWSLPLRNISHQAIFYPKSIYSIKSYKLEYKLFADHIHNIELYGSHSQYFFYLPKLICIYNDLGRSAMSIDEIYQRNVVKIVKKQLGISASIYLSIRRSIAKFKRLVG